MGKNIKSYATTQVVSPGKGREASQQKVQIFRVKNMIWLNRTHSFLNLQTKFFKQIFYYVLYFAKFPANYTKICPNY